VAKPVKKAVKKAPKKAAKKASAARKPKFKFPPKEKRCEKLIVKKEAFHEKSFRNMLVRTKDGDKVFLTIGCLKSTKPRGHKKGYKTVWRTEAPFVETKSQCRYAEGPLKGKKAGTRAHITTRELWKGKCREGYKKYTPPKKRVRR
jgi:hypothetical protein